MDDANRSIARSLKNGQYYVDARNWYSVRFLYPQIERTFYFLVLCATAIFLFIVFSFYSFLSNDVQNLTYVTYPEDSISQETKIYSLDTLLEPTIAVTEYLIKNYVTSWENYDYNNLANQVSFIQNNSSSLLGGFFTNYMSINNTNSPLFFYGQNYSRNVTISSVTVDDRKKTATVNFVATLNDLGSNNSSVQTNWSTQISYSMSDLQTLISNNATKVDFMVLKYQSAQVK